MNCMSISIPGNILLGNSLQHMRGGVSVSSKKIRETVIAIFGQVPSNEVCNFMREKFK